ncbi:MAG: MerR family transcriptional regulator [Clostridiales bacterium]|nr:MAG: MerR family transcriptional regulator [Clostridiales bacterium]
MEKYSVSEVAKLTGISVRTLHYYDEIGLLKPSELSESRYRYYDREALAELQQILFYRELDFPLREIREMMQSPGYDRREALRNHRELLKLKRERLDRLIGLADDTLKGEKDMSFEAFDVTAVETARKQFAEETKSRWGNTSAYAESERRAGGYSKEDWTGIQAEMDGIFRSFAALVGKNPASPEAQELVRRWQVHITAHYYDCTEEIIAGLGEMYLCDERFQKNLDQYGEGTAAFVSEAIRYYCGK